MKNTLSNNILEKLNSMDEKYENQFNQINRRLDSMDGRLDSMDARFEDMDGRFDSMDGRLEDMNTTLDKVRASITVMESNYGLRIDALLEYASVTTTAHESFDEKISLIIDKMDVHSWEIDAIKNK